MRSCNRTILAVVLIFGGRWLAKRDEKEREDCRKEREIMRSEAREDRRLDRDLRHLMANKIQTLEVINEALKIIKERYQEKT